MRIGIDARLWGEPRSGIGRYTRALVEALLQLAPAERFVLYLDRPPAAVPPGVEVRCLPWPQRLVWTLWAAPRALRHEPVDLFHGVTGFELPPRGTGRLVTTVHDLIPLQFPDLVPRRHRWAVRCLLGPALRRAARVIAVSHSTRDALLGRYRLPPERVRVVHEAAGPAFRPPGGQERDAVRARHGLVGPYLLFVGLLEPKKNLEVVLDAVARLRARRAWGDTRLVVAGAPGWGPDPRVQVRALGLESVVRFLGPVPDADLPALYAEAVGFVFPSQWEGFGLPVLEAMASGTPVIAARRGALPEITAGAALLVEPEPEAVADAMAAFLDDPAQRTRLREAGLARAAGFSWERAGCETLAVYREALEAPSP